MLEILEDYKHYTVSALAIIPVFLLIIPTYIFFGYVVPTNPFSYIYFALITFLMGLVSYYYVNDKEIDSFWALKAGVLRWFFVTAIFFLTEVVNRIGLSSLTVGELERILTLQFAFELPAMIVGYWIALKLYEVFFS